MRYNKQFVSALAVVIVGSSLLSTTPAYAADSTSSQGGNFFSGLVQMIAQKFGLDKTQVQSAVDDYHTQKKADMQPVSPSQGGKNMQERVDNRLDQAVKDGKITSAQKDAIVAEQVMLKSKYDPAKLKDMTPEDRKKQLDAMKAEVDAWAKANGVDPNYLMPGFGFGGHMMMRKMVRGDWGEK